MGRRGSPYNTVEVDGLKVRAIREGELGISQQALASRAEMTRGYVSVIEGKARARLTRPIAERLASALGTGIDELAPTGAEEPVSLAHSALPVSPARKWPVGERLQRLVGAAQLTEEEQEIFGTRLLPIARELVATIRDFRKPHADE